MKLLFCYDGPIEKDQDGNYYSTALTDEMFSRYNCISDDITIAIRVNNTQKADVSKKYMPLSKDKYKIVECPNIASVRGMLLKRRSCYEILKKCVAENDAIVIRLPSFIGNVAFKVCEKMKKKYIVEMVGCPWDALWNYNLKGKIIAPIMRKANRKALSETDYALYVSNSFLQNRYPTKGNAIACSNVILYNIDSNVLNKRINKIKRMKDPKKIVMGTLGAIDINYKGQQYVIRAMKKLLNNGYHVEYQIVGEGLPDFLESVCKKYKVDKYVKIMGPMKHDRVFDWIDSLDIYIQPSNQEGLCRSIIEAMSRACPVIASDAGGNPELINNDFVFKKKHHEELCDCIMKMNKENMLREAKNNYNNSKQYDYDTLLKRRTAFYKKYAKEVEELR